MSTTNIVTHEPRTIKDILTSPNWQAEIAARFPDCDINFWKQRRTSILNSNPKPKRRTRTPSRTSKARQVLAQNRAVTQLVTRVNRRPEKMSLTEQTAMAEAWEAANPDDSYGIEERRL